MLKLYDKNHNLIAPLPDDGDTCVEKELSGIETLSFTYPQCKSEYPQLAEECFIRTDTNEYVVKELNVNEDWTDVVCKVNTNDFLSVRFDKFDIVEDTITNVMNTALAGTLWSVGHCDITKKRTVHLTNATALDVLTQVQSTWMCDVSIDAINKQINFYSSMGSDKGAYFITSLNLNEMNIQRNSYDIYTRIIPIGKNGLTIASVNGGNDYIDNFQYTNRILIKYWVDTRYTVAQDLYDDAVANLNIWSQPMYAHTVNVIDLAKIDANYNILSYDLGDTVTVEDDKKSYKVKQRIVKTKSYLYNPEKNTVDITNRPLTLQDMQKEQQDTVDTVDAMMGQDGSLDSTALATTPLNASNITLGTLDASKINVTNISAGSITTGSLDASKVTVLNLSASVIQTGTLDATKVNVVNVSASSINTGTLDASKVTVSNLSASVIQTGTLSASVIGAGTITVDKLSSNVGNSLDISSNNSITIRATKDYVSSRGQNLVTNGTALLGDNTNFSTFVLDKSDAMGSGGSFKDSTYNTVRNNDEFIPVDASQLYRYSFYGKTNPSVGAHYYGTVVCYDVDKLQILPQYTMFIANTLTTLSSDLKPGDTAIYLTSAANWINSAGANTQQRSMIVWNYKNAGGYQYAPLTYSRNYYGYDLWSDGAVDTVNNKITLKTAWTGPTIPAGTQVSNGNSGGTYKYCTNCSNSAIPSTWTQYTGTIGSIDTSGANSTNKFHPATAYVKIGWLNNRDVTGSTVWYSNISFGLDDVVSNNIISAINVTPESITIQASKISILGTTNIADAAITTAKILDGSITTAKIVDANITGAKIASATIQTANIATGAITTALIATAAIGTTQIADSSITDAKIVTLTANKITAGTIDASKINVTNLNCANLTVGTINGVQISSGAIDPTKLTTDLNNTINNASSNAQTALSTANGKNTVYYAAAAPTGTFTTNDIWFDTANGYKLNVWNGTAWVASQLGTNAIANLAITNALIADATIQSAKISALDAGKITTGYLAAARIQAGTITGTMIAGTTITASNIVANTITASQIAAGTITATQIASATITGDRLVAATITGDKIAANTITANNIVANTITAGQIASATITATQIASGTITGALIAAGTITGDKIAANTITADKIITGTGSVGSGNVAAGKTWSIPTANWTTTIPTTSASTTISAASSAGATTLTLTSVTGVVVGMTLTIGAESIAITAINGSVVTLASALVNAYAISTAVTCNWKATVGDTTINLTSVTSIVVGTTFMIGSEIKSVTAINGTVVTINSGLASAYNPGTTVTLCNDYLLDDGAKNVGSAYFSFGSGNQSNNNTEGAYVQVDLGATYRVSQSRAYFYSADSRYYYYKIKYSPDGTNWFYATGNSSNTGWVTSAPSTSGLPTNNPTIDTFYIPIVARYIRWYANGNNVNTGNHVYELELYTTPVTIIDGGMISTGTLDASKVTVTNLNASNITGGTIDASKVTVTNLNANNITSGTISGDKISGGTINGTIINAKDTLNVSSNIWNNGTSYGVTFGGTVTNYVGPSTLKYYQDLPGNGGTALTFAMASGAQFVVQGALGISLNNVQIDGNSNLTAPSFYTGNWFRSTGATGWYSQTYGGGIYCNDSTYVKVYGGKHFWCDSNVYGGNLLAYYGSIYGERLYGYSNNDRVSLGTGNCRFDTGGGELRLYTSPFGSADYGIHELPTGEIQFVHNSTVGAWIGSDGSVHGTSKSAITDTLDYGVVTTYSDESPDHVFNDRGRGTLDANGECIVMFDPIYIETVNTSNGNYNVQLTGIKTANVYVDDLQPTYFVVKGEPGKDFFWEVTAQRLGWENMRWNDADFTL